MTHLTNAIPMAAFQGQRNDDGRFCYDVPPYSPRNAYTDGFAPMQIPMILHPFPVQQTQIGNASPTQEHRLPEKLSETNLYIRGLSAETTDQDLHKMCEKFGKIVSTKAIVDNETSKCKGYGFVDFENPDSARKAVDKLQAEGKLVQMAKKQEEDPTNIYFSNLPDWIGDKSLREMLDPYGEVVSTRILRHPGQNGSEGRSKGVGFARMHLKEQCEKIIEKFNGQPLTDPNNPAKATAKPLLVKFADGGPKKKKNHQLNITTNFRRDDMMMETHGLPLAWHPMALPAYTPNVPTASYSPYLPSFQAPFAQVPVGDVNFLNQAVGLPAIYNMPQPAYSMPEPEHSQPDLNQKQEQHSD